MWLLIAVNDLVVHAICDIVYKLFFYILMLHDSFGAVSIGGLYRRQFHEYLERLYTAFVQCRRSINVYLAQLPRLRGAGVA